MQKMTEEMSGSGFGRKVNALTFETRPMKFTKDLSLSDAA